MSKVNPDKFNYARMSERVTIQEMDSNGSYSDTITLWSHVSKDGFTRSETDNWFKFLLRDHPSLEPLLAVSNRFKWKNLTFSIFSWQAPTYENKKFIEVMVKQIATSTGATPGPADDSLFSDVVIVYNMTKITTMEFGLPSYKYEYDFSTPSYTGIPCRFTTDRNRYLEDKTIDVEHDALIVEFNKDAPITSECYIQSPIHGRFKVDMVIKDEKNQLCAYVQRSEVQ